MRACPLHNTLVISLEVKLMILSVVIPSYNAEKHIGRTLESLVNQTCQDFEVIVVDDGSVDETPAAAEKILSDSWIKNYKIIRKVNGGVSSARNAGLYASSADYVLFLDADDYVSCYLVERVISVSNDKTLNMVCWGYDIVNENKMTMSNFSDKYTFLNVETSGIEVLKKIIIEKCYYVWTGSAVYHRKWLLMHNLVYTLGCANGEDQEFTYKVLSKAKSVHLISEVLSYYVQRVGSISQSFDIKRFDVVNALSRTGDYLKQLEHPELNDVISCITDGLLVRHYLGNYLACIHYLTSCSDLSKKESIEYLNRELDIKYPRMRKAMQEHMDHYKGKSITFNLKVRLFQTSTHYYCALAGVKMKIKTFLRRDMH